ncbi:response regulator transcription factor [Nostoc sp. NIES-2111]
MRHLLLVDDDKELTVMLDEYLASEGFSVSLAHLASEGLEKAIRLSPDLVILDVMLPDLSGFETLRRLRTQSDVPVLMLTAKAEDLDRIVGLELGADDYVRKPFNPRELVARAQSILRRTTPRRSPESSSVAPASLKVGDLHLDLTGRLARAKDTLIELTSVEFELLRLLLVPPGRVVSREEIFRTVLGREYSVFDRSADNHISSLRKKLGLGQDGMERIKSVRNLGYVYVYLLD